MSKINLFRDRNTATLMIHRSDASVWHFLRISRLDHTNIIGRVHTAQARNIYFNNFQYMGRGNIFRTTCLVPLSFDCNFRVIVILLFYIIIIIIIIT